MSDLERQRRWKTALTTVTLIALAGLAYAVRHQLLDTVRNLWEVNLIVLVFVIPLSLMNHLAQARLYKGLFEILGDRFRLRSLVRLSYELNFINTVFPSGGVSGFSYISYRMKNEGVSTAKATLVQIMRFFLVFVAFQVLLFVGLIALAIGGQANDFIILVAGSLSTLLLISTMGFAYIIGSKSRINGFFTLITRGINRVIKVVRPKHPETINISRVKAVFTELHENYLHIKRNLSGLKKPLFYALVANVTEIASIYTVYIAFGDLVNPGAVILAYAVANFAGLVSVLPGGVGIYEALMTGVLVAGGVPAALSLPVTVMYRVLSMLLQLPPGYFSYQKALHANTPAEEFKESIKFDE